MATSQSGFPPPEAQPEDYLTERQGAFANPPAGSSMSRTPSAMLGNTLGRTASSAMPPPPPPTSSLLPLPVGWAEVYDPNSGRPYYVHESTGESTWTRPEPSAGPHFSVLLPQQHARAAPAAAAPNRAPEAGQQHAAENQPEASHRPTYVQSSATHPQQHPPFAPQSVNASFPNYPSQPMQGHPYYPTQPQPPPPPQQQQAPHPGVVPQSSYGVPPFPAMPEGASGAATASAMGRDPSRRESYDMSELYLDDGEMSRAASSVSRAVTHAESMAKGGDGVSSKLQLEFSASNLRNKDWIGQSDPVLVVDMQTEGGKWARVGRTEIIENNLNPHWKEKITVDYCFEKVQLLRFTVLDVDRVKQDGRTILKHQFLGQLNRVLASILLTGTATYDLTARAGAQSHRPYGRLCIRVHEDANPRSFYRVKATLRASGLDKMDRGLFKKSDPYVTIKHIEGAGQSGASILAQSEIIMKTLDPKWEPLTFDVDPKSEDINNVKLQFCLTDWDKRKSHDPLGAVEITMAQLRAPNPGPFDVINPESSKYKTPGYKNSGRLFVESVSVVEVPSHVKYLQGGCRLKVMCAVDMTSSNGSHHTDPSSPHYRTTTVPSQYARALRAVGDVVAPFLPDDDIMMAYAFGAKHAYSEGEVSYAFPLNPAALHSKDARVLGTNNLVMAYEACVENVEFGKTACFADILGEAISISTASPPTQEDQHYTILLIFSNGSLEDLDRTIRKIVEASLIAPLSIVIVGVGDNRKWSVMRQLDADNGKLPTTSDGLVAKRDIVDFVKFESNGSPAALAADIFAEIPSGLREYMSSHNIMPNPPRPSPSPYGYSQGRPGDMHPHPGAQYGAYP